MSFFALRSRSEKALARCKFLARVRGRRASRGARKKRKKKSDALLRAHSKFSRFESIPLLALSLSLCHLRDEFLALDDEEKQQQWKLGGEQHASRQARGAAAAAAGLSSSAPVGAHPQIARDENRRRRRRRRLCPGPGPSSFQALFASPFPLEGKHSFDSVPQSSSGDECARVLLMLGGFVDLAERSPVRRGSAELTLEEELCLLLPRFPPPCRIHPC